MADFLQQYKKKEPEFNPSKIDEDTVSTTNTIIDSLSKWKKILYSTALAAKNEAEMINGLLASGVFSSSGLYADYDGRTPMYLAAANGHLEVVRVLQFYGDNGTTHKDRWGNCALDEARRKKFDRIVDILLDDIV